MIKNDDKTQDAPETEADAPATVREKVAAVLLALPVAPLQSRSQPVLGEGAASRESGERIQRGTLSPRLHGHQPRSYRDDSRER